MNSKTYTFIINSFIVAGFLDEVLTVKLGFFFLSPMKIVCAIAVLFFFIDIKDILGHRFPKLVLAFCALCFFIMLNLIFTSLAFPVEYSVVERLIHFGGSVAGAVIIYNGLYSGKIDIQKTFRVVKFIFWLDLVASLIEVISRRPLLNFGILASSPLTVRGFHGDRIFLVEYLFLGLIILYNGGLRGYKLLMLFITCSIVVFSSGSNTGILFILLFILFIVMKDRRFFLRLILLLALPFSFFLIQQVRNATLNQEEKIMIRERNDEYFGKDKFETNWRLFVSRELLNNFYDDPTFVGNGYDMNARFLATKARLDKPMLAHTVLSVLYDFGLVGAIILFIFLFLLLKKFFLSLFHLKHLSITFVFSSIILARLLFYYHTSIIWFMVIGIPIICNDVKRYKLIRK